MTEPASARSRALTGDRRPPSRGDHQRALILDAVTELLATVPIADLSVMQVAKQAGVTRPVFYFYFESKYVAVAAALERVWGQFDAARSLVTQEVITGPPGTVSRQLIRDAFAVWRQHAPLLNACVQGKESDLQLATMWDAFVGLTATRVSEIFIALHAQGQIRPASADIPALVDALLGMTLWSLLHESSLPVEDHARMIDAINAVWLAALWGESSS